MCRRCGGRPDSNPDVEGEDMMKKTYWLFCDGCGNQYMNTAETFGLVKAMAKADGWTYSKSTGDLCTNCVQEGRIDFISSVQPSAGVV